MPYIEESVLRGGPLVAALLLLAFLLAAVTAGRILTGWADLRAARNDLGGRPGRRRFPATARLAAAWARAAAPGLERALRAESQRLRAGLRLVAALTALAPLVGLLGTVAGMTEAFLATAGGRTDLGRLGAGISQALLTTLAGLLVAIPGVLCHAGLEALVRAEERALRRLGDRIAGREVHHA